MGVFDRDNQPFDDEGIANHISQAIAAKPPQGLLLESVYQTLKLAFKPTLFKQENIPDGPCLFVANHALFALDGMMFLPLMLHDHGRFIRSMSDKALWNDVSKDILINSGGIIGDPRVCSALMENGNDLLVFPGGAYEACKTKAESYKLMWKERYGFIKLAATYGYTIMPVAFVGPDEFYSHRIEGQDIPNTLMGKLMRNLGVLNDNTRTDILPPIPSGVLGILIPKPHPVYIQFGEAVDLSDFEGKTLTTKQLQTFRSRVATEIETGLSDLLEVRDKEKSNQSSLRRWLTR
jgi:1-acyl-sn-glycerol-3-phosphate acyltransferase